ncbi:Serine protease [Corynebacterium pseudotuberculosis]|nr:Serine protease [Corynebacterium pseudotuberculosis]
MAYFVATILRNGQHILSQETCSLSRFIHQTGTRYSAVCGCIVVIMTNQFGTDNTNNSDRDPRTAMNNSEQNPQTGQNNSYQPNPYIRGNSEKPMPTHETREFDRVHNPYAVNASSTTGGPAVSNTAPEGATGGGAAHSQGFSQGVPQHMLGDEPPVMEQPVKEKKTIGLGAATALALVAAVAAGSITGVYASKVNTGSTKSTVVESLKQPVADTTNKTAPAGSVQSVASQVLPSVVSIMVTSEAGVSEGSGSIISEDGYVMTNNHVVAQANSNRAKVSVTMNDGSTHDAEFVAGDPNTDVAVIKIKGASGLPVMNFGDSSKLQVGQQVVAIGSPLGLSATVTSGIVSALNRPVRAGGSETGQSSLIDAVQTDAAINPGNSGGPLVDSEGKQIGINSVIASLSQRQSQSGAQAGSIGLGFAIPSNFARRVAAQLIETGKATQPMIGIQLVSNARVKGAVIADVTEGAPGSKAGLKPGEIITKINGRVVDSADALIAAVRSSDFGSTVKLTVVDENGENSRSVDVTLTSE